MQLKILLIWIATVAVLVITGCSASPTITKEVPTTVVPPPPAVRATLAPKDSPTTQPTAKVEPTYTIVVPTAEPTADVQVSTGQGDQILQSVCTVCHSSDRIMNSHKSQAEWETTVNRMIGHGAVVSDSDKQILILYLSETYK